MSDHVFCLLKSDIFHFIRLLKLFGFPQKLELLWNYKSSSHEFKQDK